MMLRGAAFLALRASSFSPIMERVPHAWAAMSMRISSSSSNNNSKDGNDKDNKLVLSEKPDSSLEGIKKEGGRQGLITKRFVKPLESSYETNRPIPDGLARAWDCLKPKSRKKTKFLKDGFDAYYDICIIGGGVMGCSIAYWLASRVYEGLKICVVEKDSSYRKCATTLSVGGIRQQFSMPENVELSLFGADFLRQTKRLLYAHGVDMPDINFQPHGYLFLATEKGAEIMEENHAVQIECGAKVELLTAARLKRKFPWINTDGIVLASYGYENEGWFDPWALMTCLKLKAMDLGVHFIPGEVYNMAHEINVDKYYTEADVEEDEAKRIFNRIIEAHVHLTDGDVWPVSAPIFIVAAGAESGHVAHLAGVGAGSGILRVPLPVEPRKRFVYCVHAPEGPGLNCPLVVDPSGAYFRREGMGGHYLLGRSPESKEEEPSIDNWDVDHGFFDEKVWPVLADRVPAFNNLKVHSSWAGCYDYNFWDQNAIVGTHPHHDNLYFATGFSGHGIQQAPAIGRAIMELILDGDYQTIDLTRLGFDRVLNDIKMQERNIV